MTELRYQNSTNHNCKIFQIDVAEKQKKGV